MREATGAAKNRHGLPHGF